MPRGMYAVLSTDCRSFKHIGKETKGHEVRLHVSNCVREDKAVYLFWVPFFGLLLTASFKCRRVMRMGEDKIGRGDVHFRVRIQMRGYSSIRLVGIRLV